MFFNADQLLILKSSKWIFKFISIALTKLAYDKPQEKVDLSGVLVEMSGQPIRWLGVTLFYNFLICSVTRSPVSLSDPYNITYSIFGLKTAPPFI